MDLNTISEISRKKVEENQKQMMISSMFAIGSSMFVLGLSIGIFIMTVFH